jgi:hypothetical protein
MVQIKEQGIGGSMGPEIIDNGIDALDFRRYPSVDLGQEIDPVGGDSSGIGASERRAHPWAKGAENVTFARRP